MKPRLLVVCGPTASGKTDLALEIAARVNGEIVCADSLTVYRGLDIGSAKPSPAQLATVPHHLVSIRDPDETFTAADFRSESEKAISAIICRGRRPIVVGGTGLYIRALLGGLAKAPGENQETRKILMERAAREGNLSLFEELMTVDPASAGKCHPNNLVRIIRALEVWHVTGTPLSSFHEGHGFTERPYNCLSLYINLPRPQLYSRIDARVDAMIEAGLVDEVKSLLAAGVSEGAKGLQAIGYKEVTALLRGDTDLQTMKSMIRQNTRNLAKRQITWFRKETDVYHVAYPENSANIFCIAEKFFNQGEKPHVQDPLQHSGSVPEPGPQGKGPGHS